MNKHDMRIHIRDQFKNKSQLQLSSASQKIYHHLFDWYGWENATNIAITMSTDNEIDTLPIIEKGWQERKNMAVPRVDPINRKLHFYKITAVEDTKKEFAGIREPDPARTELLDHSALELIIVPGLAFDKDKYRLGFGGGYYDRLLSRLSVLTCGLSLDFQLFDEVPREAHDIPLDAIVTENGII
ncbi:5-formyltetrahydrofolate cyclo-ligase [Alteribacillus iranensis]|uniref:5-formyltetrahydrofolate cyclo-ligase n=1 Tax=Alteribacillus iranensis TaxID=930128 RepID=A0A1I1ZH57_9BACI|nr:5-formyltetrahydrofolate cyclo-ligase [Alteribacillus iranensis]SFE29893.1 5-formyltetrahydrofolate cyclo-ligase [Alteribacillus iranensis]